MENKILIIDDDENIRHLLHLELSDLGYKVITVGDASSGLNILKTKKINLVVLDIKMSGMEGIEALEKIICLDKKYPIIIHSAYSHYKENFLTWSATDYVLKSGNTKVLLDTIDKHIKLSF